MNKLSICALALIAFSTAAIAAEQPVMATPVPAATLIGPPAPPWMTSAAEAAATLPDAAQTSTSIAVVAGPAEAAVTANETPRTAGKKGKADKASDDEQTLPPAPDVDETLPLPPYPANARVSIGKETIYHVGEEDTLLDIARHFRLGFVEIRASNPGVDPWTPVPGEEVKIPAFKLLPRAQQEGIVVNLAQMRLYYFHTPGKEPITFPIGVGREGLQTPTGQTTVIRKAAGPSWFPTDRMRTEKPWLPKAVPPGPSNPLGTHALYLGWPTFLIHGSNKPWAIGRRVSSGCMRMYPEDIKALFEMVPVGTKVTVVDQPIMVGWVNGTLYLEADASKSQSNDIEITGEHAIKELTEGLKKVITDAAGIPAERIDWEAVRNAVETRHGYPIAIAKHKGETAEVSGDASAVKKKEHQN